MRRGIAVIGVVLAGALAAWWFFAARSGAPTAPEPALAERTGPALPSTEDPAEWSRRAPIGNAPLSARPNETPALRDPPTEDDGVFEVQVSRAGTALRAIEVRAYLRGPRDPSTLETQWRLASKATTGASGLARLPARPGAYLLSVHEGEATVALREASRPVGEKATRVSFELEALRPLSGRTVRRGQRAPVPLAEVTLTWTDAAGRGFGSTVPAEERLYAHSDERGEFAFAGVPEGTYRIEARATGEGKSGLRVLKVPTTEPVVLELGGAGTIEGFVVRADGAPAAGATVQVIGSLEPQVTETGEGGSFSVEVQPGTHWVSAKLGSTSGTLERSVSVGAGQTASAGTLKLGEGAVFEGAVLAKSSRAPIANASISVSPLDLNGDTARAYTGSDGRFRIEGLPTGSHDVVVDAQGYSELVRKGVTVGQGETFPLELLLEGTGTVSGIVKDARGRAVAGARVTGGNRWGGPFVNATAAEAVSDADGRFALAGLEVGDVRLTARRREGEVGGTAVARIVEGQTAEVELVFRDSGTVRGRVTTRDGAAASGAHVTAAPTTGVFGRNDLFRATTEEDGRYALELPVGKWRIGVLLSEEGFPRFATMTPIEIAADATVERDLVVPSSEENPEAFVTGVVLEPGGVPSTGALVAVSRVERPMEVLSVTLADQEQGHFQLPRSAHLESLPSFALQALVGGRTATVSGLKPGARDVLLQLQEPGAIEGTIEGATGAYFVTARLQTGLGQWGVPTRELRGSSFVLREVPAGTVQLKATTDDGREASETVTVRPGETSRVALTLQVAAVIRGRAIDAVTRAPLDRGWASLVGVPGGAPVGPDGIFELKGMTSGTVELRVFCADHKPLSRTITVAEGERVELGDVALEVFPGG